MKKNFTLIIIASAFTAMLLNGCTTSTHVVSGQPYHHNGVLFHRNNSSNAHKVSNHKHLEGMSGTSGFTQPLEFENISN